MLHKKGIERRNKMIHAAVVLFLENGYEKTTTARIAKAAGFSATSFFAAFSTKEELLLTLVKFMFSGQFLELSSFLRFRTTLWFCTGLKQAFSLT